MNLLIISESRAIHLYKVWSSVSISAHLIQLIFGICILLFIYFLTSEIWTIVHFNHKYHEKADKIDKHNVLFLVFCLFLSISSMGITFHNRAFANQNLNASKNVIMVHQMHHLKTIYPRLATKSYTIKSTRPNSITHAHLEKYHFTKIRAIKDYHRDKHAYYHNPVTKSLHPKIEKGFLWLY